MSKSSARPDGWPDAIKRQLAAIESELTEMQKAFGITNKTKRKRFIKSQLKCEIDHDGETFPSGTVDSHKPVKIVEGDFWLNSKSDLAVMIQNEPKEQIKYIGKYLLPAYEHLLKYARDFNKQHGGKEISLSLLERFIEEGANKWTPKK